MTYFPKPVKPADTKAKEGGAALLAWGLDGSGKSHFAIDTADLASQLVYLNFDRDVTHLLAKYKGADYVHEKFTITDNRELAQLQCQKVEEMVQWAVRDKKPKVVVFDNVANWRELSNNAFLPESGTPIPRDYEKSNNHQRRVGLLLENSHVWTVFTAPAGVVWTGQQTKAQEVKGEDLLESKAWDGLDFCVVGKVYLYNLGDKRMLRPAPVEQPEAGRLQFKAYIQKAKIRPKVQGVVLDNPTLKEVWEMIR